MQERNSSVTCRHSATYVDQILPARQLIIPPTSPHPVAPPDLLSDQSARCRPGPGSSPNAQVEEGVTGPITGGCGVCCCGATTASSSSCWWTRPTSGWTPATAAASLTSCTPQTRSNPPSSHHWHWHNTKTSAADSHQGVIFFLIRPPAKVRVQIKEGMEEGVVTPPPWTAGVLSMTLG